MKTIGIIPCRYDSRRFPGKPLADIHGKPMMWHVYQRALESTMLKEVYVATDDDRIKEACEQLNLNVIMTRRDHETGTDRVAECKGLIQADYYVNIQGDEPMLEPEAIDQVIKEIQQCKDPMVMATNAFARISRMSDVVDTNIVKVMVAMDNTALAFTRLPVPYPKGGEVEYFRELGLYVFRRSGLQIFSEHDRGRMETAEEVEMLRLLEYGYKVLMVEVEDKSIPVDTMADLERVRAMMSK